MAATAATPGPQFRRGAAMNPHQARRAGTVLAMARGLEGAALDYGCGWGDLTARLAPQFRSMLGVDPEANRIDFARQEYPEVAFATCAPDRVACADASMDVVFSTVVLHFVPSVDGHLAECARVLRPGGHLVITIQNPESFWMRLRRATGKPGEGPGWGGRSRADLRRRLAEHGFAVEAEDGFYDPVRNRLRTPGDLIIGTLNGLGHLFRVRGAWSYLAVRARRVP